MIMLLKKHILVIGSESKYFIAGCVYHRIGGYVFDGVEIELGWFHVNFRAVPKFPVQKKYPYPTFYV